MARTNLKYIAIIFISSLLVIYAGILLLRNSSNTTRPATPSLESNFSSSTITTSSIDTGSSQTEIQFLSAPIDNALARVTKKPFSIKVSPGNSPVSPERFSGYHTGVDFETTSTEQKIDVSIYAVCSGPLVLKRYASGYGGLAVQACQISGEDVTVVYGHLKLLSIIANVGQELKAGEKLGILGKGYSAETDGERKHLHLAIHKGKNINLLGYVSKTQDLKNWIDVMTLLK